MMISWGYKLLKSKIFLATAAIVGLVTYGIKDGKINYANTMDDERHSSNMIATNMSDFQAKYPKLRNNETARIKKSMLTENTMHRDDDDMLFIKAMMKADKEYKQNINEDLMLRNIGIASSDGTYIDTQILDKKTAKKYYNPSTQSITTVTSGENDKYNNANIIRTNSSYNDYNNKSTQENTVLDEYTETELESNDNTQLVKENLDATAKMSDNNTVFPGYITGSVIPSTESNSSNTTGVLPHNNYVIVDNNQSIFPYASKEAKHDCYFDENAQMKCRKSITTCTENGEKGLTCTVSYYLKGLWYRDPTHITIESKESWIKEHLIMKTDFAVSKFDNKYYEDRYAVTSLIRPDLNVTKRVKLVQDRKYMTEKTSLDYGVSMLLDNNNTYVETSILLRGTRFGAGHQKVKGLTSDFIEALREFLLTFMYSDDSDVYGSVDYWTLMDANNTMGDHEDFALTAMEWLLLNGVDPEYITLTELKTSRNDTTDIVLILETQEPVDLLMIRDADIIRVEDIYPEGYESLIVNEYKYVD